VPGATPPPGPGVDARGVPVVDPTANVLALVAAGNKRQDDLREITMTHIKELMALRAEYEEKFRTAESARLDANRAFDVGAVNRASDVAAEAADALRLQVAATAAAFETKLMSVIDPINVAIADLRRTQYQLQGERTQVTESRGSSAAVYAAITLGVMLLLAAVTLTAFVIKQVGG
jgi:hypothetical protein